MGDILFLTHRVPFPPDRGDKIRSFNILQKLCACAPVHLATFADDEDDMAHGKTLRPILASLHIERRRASRAVGAAKAILTGKPMSLTMFASAALREFVDRTLEEKEIDSVVVFSGQMAQFVPDLPPDIRFIMDFVDMDSAKFAEYGQSTAFPMNLVHKREAKTLSRFESRVAGRADAALFVSETEAELFRATSGARNVVAVENGIDFDSFDPGADIPTAEIEGKGPLIVFTGQMDYRPNIEAVSSFALEALPIVRTAIPEARFAIVGRHPSIEVRKLARHDGVIVTGSVPDIRSWLAAADVVVAPLRMARGIQNKVLEAMAMGRPVVASRPAFEGIDAVHERDLLVADGPIAEADAVLRLLDDPYGAEAMGRAARDRMLDRYNWNATLAPLGRLLGRAEGSELAEAAE